MTLNPWLRRFVLSGIFAILLVPLVYLPERMVFPFITGKNFMFRIVVELMSAALLILAYRDASVRPRKSWMLAALCGFVGVLAIADIFGENFYHSFWSDYERMEGLIGHLHLLAYFVILSVMLTTEKLWERFFQASLGVSVIVALYGLGQLLGKLEVQPGAVRVAATLGNATYLAVYMFFHIFIAAMLMLRETTGKALRWGYAGILLLDAFILYHTATRGTILGLLGGALLSCGLLIVLNGEHARLRKAAIGMMALLMIPAGAIFLFRDASFVANSPVLSRFTAISLTEGHAKTRFLLWNMSWQGVKEHPLLGWGQENYILVFNKYYDVGMHAQEPWFDRSHNVLLDWLIAGGIPALLAYLALFGIAFYGLGRAGGAFSPTEKSLLIGLLAGYLFQNLFVFDNLTSYLLFYAVLAYILWRERKPAAAAPLKPPMQRGAPTPTLIGRLYIPAVLVITLLVVVFANLKPLLASISLRQGLKPQQQGNETSLRYITQALSYNTFGNGETREHLLQAAVQAQSLNATPELKRKFFDTARREMLVQIDENRKNARYELLFASFLNSFSLHDDALKHLARARELSPRRQAILLEIGRSYSGKGNYRKALQAIGEAYELEPDYADTRFLLGVTGLLARGEHGKVAELWRMRVASDPANVQYRYALAAAYLRAGERDKSVAEIRQLIAVQPEFKSRGEYYIEEIQAGRNP